MPVGVAALGELRPIAEHPVRQQLLIGVERRLREIQSNSAAVALLTAATTALWSYSPSTERYAAAGTVIGHCKNFHSLAGTKASELLPH